MEMYTAEAEDDLLSGNPAFVIDAIDNIDTKVKLLAACKRRGIPVICVAGAGEMLISPRSSQCIWRSGVGGVSGCTCKMQVLFVYLKSRVDGNMMCWWWQSAEAGC